MPNAIVLGDWHLASVTAAALIKLDYRVRVWAGDFDATLAVIRGERAAAEPGVGPLLEPGAGDCAAVRNEEDLAKAARTADVAVVAFDTSTTGDGSIANDLPSRSVRLLWELSRGRCPLVVRSQMRAGSCDALLKELAGTSEDPRLVYLPENLRLGTALDDFLNPSFLVVGCNLPPPPPVTELLNRLKVEQQIHLRLVEAELVKHGINTFLAMCIAFANDLGWIARDLGARAGLVLSAVQADPRIGSRAPLRPGDAYAGGTLQRDVRALHEHAKTVGRDGLFDAISRSNTVHSMATIAVLDRALDGLEERHVCLLGLTYKPNVSTLRDSPALRLARMLEAQGCRITAYDPVAEPFVSVSPVARSATLYDAVAGADCVVWMTPHDAIRLDDLVDARPAQPILLNATNTSRVLEAPAGWTLIDLWTT